MNILKSLLGCVFLMISSAAIAQSSAVDANNIKTGTITNIPITGSTGSFTTLNSSGGGIITNPQFSGTTPGAGTVPNLIGLPVQAFGAVCDGTTDDTAAFNAASAYARANFGATVFAFKILLPRNVKCVLKGTWDFTFFNVINAGGSAQKVGIDGDGSTIVCQQTAQTCIDMLGSGQMNVEDLTIYGDPAYTPTIGYLRGSAVNGQASAGADFTNARIRGTFSAAADYNRGSENGIFSHEIIGVTAPHAIIFDGTNYWNYTSQYTSGATFSGFTQLAVVGGSVFNSGDVVSLTMTNAAITGFPVTVSYTLGAAETAITVAEGLATATGQNNTLKQASSTCTYGVHSAPLNIVQCAIPYATVLSYSVTGTGNETITFDSDFHSGDTASMIFTDSAIGGFPITKTYTLGGQSSGSVINTGLVSAIRADSSLAAAGITAALGSGLAVVHYSGASVGGVTLTTGLTGTGTEQSAAGVNQNQAQTFNNNIYVGLSVGNSSPTGDCIWENRSYNLEFIGSYCASSGLQAITIDGSTSNPAFLSFDMHIEPPTLPSEFLFINFSPITGGGITGFRYQDMYPSAYSSIFALDPGTTALRLNDLNLNIGAGAHPNAVLFDQPSEYTYTGAVSLAYSTMWNGATPSTLSSLCTPTCQVSAPIVGAAISGSTIASTAVTSATQLQETGTLAFPTSSEIYLDNNLTTSTLTGSSNGGDIVVHKNKFTLSGSGTGGGAGTTTQSVCDDDLTVNWLSCTGFSGRISNDNATTLTNGVGVSGTLINNAGTISDLQMYTTTLAAGANTGTISLYETFKCPFESGVWGTVTAAYCLDNIDPRKQVFTAGNFSMGNSTQAAVASFGVGGSFPVHLVTVQATAPVLSGCGSGTPSVIGTDSGGTVSMGAGATGCVLTFNSAYNSTPFCVVSWRGSVPTGATYDVSPTAITFTQPATSGNKAVYICLAQSGN